MADAYGTESLASEQMHTKWVRLTSYSKPAMIGLMQFHVNNHIAKIKFPQLIAKGYGGVGWINCGGADVEYIVIQ